MEDGTRFIEVVGSVFYHPDFDDPGLDPLVIGRDIVVKAFFEAYTKIEEVERG